MGNYSFLFDNEWPVYVFDESTDAHCYGSLCHMVSKPPAARWEAV
jgi:hypothetical protein